MKLSHEEVKHIALLVKLGLSETETEKFRHQLSDILENIEILNQIDISNLSPTAQSISLQNVLRADEVKDSYPVEDILANAPQQDSSCFKVKAVLE